ncbi:TolB family protein [Candidatus Omnitrophota bacterium]
MNKKLAPFFCIVILGLIYTNASVSAADLEVTGVIDGDSPIAIVNNNMIKVGDKIGEATVIEIGKNEVIFRDNIGVFSINMGSKTRQRIGAAAPQADRAGRGPEEGTPAKMPSSMAESMPQPQRPSGAPGQEEAAPDYSKQEISLKEPQGGSRQTPFSEYKEIATVTSKDLQSLKLTPSFIRVSPDGKTIAFSSAGPEEYELYLIDSDGGNKRALIEDPALGHQIYPIWSYDSAKIAFLESDSYREKLDLYVVNRDGTGLRKVASNIWILATPCWSRDNKKLIFQKAEERDVDICTVDIQKLKAEKLFFSKGPVFNLCVSPDGRQIAFLSSETPLDDPALVVDGSELDVGIYDLETGEIKKIPLFDGKPQMGIAVSFILPEIGAGEKIKWIDNNRLIAAVSLVDIKKGTAQSLNISSALGHMAPILLCTSLSSDNRRLLFNKQDGLYEMSLSDNSAQRKSEENVYTRWWNSADNELIVLDIGSLEYGGEIIIGRARLYKNGDGPESAAPQL